MAVDYLPVATGGGANVDSQGNFAASGYQTQGFTAGVAQSAQVNKILRQASMVAAAVANYIANQLSISVLDDGNLTTLINNLTAAIRTGSNKLQVITFNATPIFDASLGNVFEITLTGNVTGGTLINMLAGQPLTFIIHQDGTGGRTFVPPSNLPLATIASAASKVSVQMFMTGNGLTVYPSAGMTVS